MDAGSGMLTDVGVVVIGKDEGERLVRSLRSVVGKVRRVVYVDSGSRDGSPERAAALGADVVALDAADGAFTAARGRNAGLRRLLELEPRAPFVQFLDGDCALALGWLELGAQRLRADRGLVAVCGQLRELEPERSRFKRLLDLEWRRPAGPTDACGGLAMYRVAAVCAVGGFAPGLAAGEEPELCLRLRRAGGRLERLDAAMGWHDGDLVRFGQWWRRTERAGWAAAAGWALQGGGRERFNLARVRSAWIWGAAAPLLALALAWPTGGVSLLAAAAAYALLALRVGLGRWRRGDRPAEAALYAAFCVLGKLPEAIGQARYWRQERAASFARYDPRLAAAASGAPEAAYAGQEGVA